MEFVGAVRGYQKRMEHQWEHTRYIGALLININRDPKKPSITPQQLMPLSFDKKEIKAPTVPSREVWERIKARDRK